MRQEVGIRVMFGSLFGLWQARRARWKTDAKRLVAIDPLTAFHAAQVEVARAKSVQDRAEAWHWMKVAAEVARICAEADLDVERSVRAIRAAGFDYR